MSGSRWLGSIDLKVDKNIPTERGSGRFKTEVTKVPYKLRVINDQDRVFVNTYESPTQKSTNMQVLEVEPKPRLEKRMKSLNVRSKKTQFSQDDPPLPMPNGMEDKLCSPKPQIASQEREIKKLKEELQEKDRMLEDLIKQIEGDVKAKSKISPLADQSHIYNTFNTESVSNHPSPHSLSPSNYSTVNHIKKNSDSFVFAPKLSDIVKTKKLSLYVMENIARQKLSRFNFRDRYRKSLRRDSIKYNRKVNIS